MVMEVLHRAGEPWADLGGPMLAAMAEGRAVLWVSGSGTRQVFVRPDGGEIVRIRYGVPQSVHLFDGFQLQVVPPFFATSCGTGDGSRYRSTPPLLVGFIDGRDDVAVAMKEAEVLVERLNASGFDFDDVPAGHPAEPCGALYCPMITPEAVISPPKGRR